MAELIIKKKEVDLDNIKKAFKEIINSIAEIERQESAQKVIRRVNILSSKDYSKRMTL